MNARRTLGRGLSALLGEETPAVETERAAPGAPAAPAKGARSIAIDQLHPGRFQPRTTFTEDDMKTLIDSVIAQGILQPLLVRPHPEFAGAFEIIAGERRWRAAQKARLHEVPVMVRELGDREALEIALVENIQRADLNPIEEALGYKRLMDEFGHSQDDLAKALGKSRSHIANLLRLINLPDEIKTMVAAGQLTMGHARAILSADDPLALARQVVAQGMSVRQTERAAQGAPIEFEAKAKGGKSGAKPADANIVAVERELSESLGLQVKIAFDGKGGALTIHYKSLDQLDAVLKRLRKH